MLQSNDITLTNLYLSDKIQRQEQLEFLSSWNSPRQITSQEKYVTEEGQRVKER